MFIDKMEVEADTEGDGISSELLAVAGSLEPTRRSIAADNWGKFYVVYTDGSCRAMHGFEEGPGGWAVIVFSPRGQRWEAHGEIAHTTSNRAEVAALIAALMVVPEGSHLSVQSDSRYVVDHVRRWMRAGDNEDLWTEVRELVIGKQVELHTTWVAGHNGHQHNERADVLASKGTIHRHRRRR
ncbi:MAG: ribonuclease H family protein [Chloroflexota bacterium]